MKISIILVELRKSAPNVNGRILNHDDESRPSPEIIEEFKI
jgi:hypothetical protein